MKKSSRWIKEIKPSLQELMLDLLVLLHAACHVYLEPIFDGTDDAKDYFNQVHVAPHDRWLTGVHWTDLSGDGSHPLGSFVEEKVLGFGITSNSNIAQRISHGFMHMLHHRAIRHHKFGGRCRDGDTTGCLHCSSIRSKHY